MGFDRGRRGERGGRGRDKRDGFGEDNFSGGFGERSGPAAAAAIATAAAAAVAAAMAAIASAAAAAVIAAAAGRRRAAAAVPIAAAAVAASAAGAAAECLRRSSAKAKGVVKFFNSQKGFGFIVRDDGGEDVFVHISAVEQAGLTGLAEGQPLEFTLVDRGGRVSATDLKIEGEPLPVEDRGPPRERGGRRRSRSAS